METVTIKQCENGFIIEHNDKTYVASQIDDGFTYSKPSLISVLRNVFETKENTVTDLKVAA